MRPIQIMISGLPGDVAAKVAAHALSDERFRVLDVSLTGPDISDKTCRVGGAEFQLVGPKDREGAVAALMDREGAFMCVDYTHPSAVNDNAEFYCRMGLPFIMGTTGGDRGLLEKKVTASLVPAVIAPNMAKQIVGFQAMMEYAAETFPGLFEGYSLSIRESHQNGKADTSGTAKSMVGYFNRMGVAFSEDEIVKIRDPHVQKNELNVPEAHLAGHGWHTYTLVSKDGAARFEFSHNINGRDIYAQGTLDAAIFLQRMIDKGEKGRAFSMIEALKGAGS
ncbi:Dihydrodipicolinate reductase [Candidatus Desulfarcum epimagneticum]|uniref:4-hydroxy-tetrahydrodipicolinate reductase n=1 Tax=uncultured Desulfobacteraceae bacterium TaxID=218296 RepID=A0A484HIM4_9BACT|nr:Dihydrodipicolinate reductase [uncultured Desulfobacteraceae bacterium]